MAQGANNEERIVELETQLAHQQHLCDQLNQVLVDQSKRLMRLERVVVQLENQVKDLMPQQREIRDLLDEKPPHY